MKKIILLLSSVFIMVAFAAYSRNLPPMYVTAGGSGAAVEYNKCVYIESPTDEVFLMLWRPPTSATITEVQCKASAGTPTVNLHLPVTSEYVLSSALTCTTAAAGATSTSFTSAGAIPADEPVSFSLNGTASEDWLSVCYDYTID